MADISKNRIIQHHLPDGRRGRENLRPMKKNTFTISTDEDGKRYLHQVVDELTKNHTEKSSERANQARIYEQPGACIIILKLKHKILVNLNNNLYPSINYLKILFVNRI